MKCRKCKIEKAADAFYEGRRTCIRCMIENNYHNRDIWLLQWKEYFVKRYGNNPPCQVCGLSLDWFADDPKLRVCFDHRRGQELIKGQPIGFIRCRPCVQKHIAIFETCDFGILCSECNLRLPTVNRSSWLQNALKYSGI